MELYALILIATLTLVLCAYQYHTAKQERQELIKQLLAKDKDILDRLMAKSLPEVKQAQTPATPGEITSKRENTRRIIEQNTKIAGSR